MILPTGSRAIRASADHAFDSERRCASCREARLLAGFTLIELILVMSMLAVVIAIASPSLSRFFRGRTLDSETKRFLGLTRYGQSRAVSEGVPMMLWVDAKRGAYGLQADSTYVEEDDKQLEYLVDKDVKVEVQQSAVAQRQATLWKGRGGMAATLPKLRFTPDGFIAESSPELIVFRQGDDGEIWVGQSPNHMNYAIQTNQVQRLLR